MKLTLRDVAEDSLTALVFGPGETDRARGGGLRAGHYGSARTSRSSCTAWRSCPAVTVTGRIERFLERRISPGACGSAGAPPRMACSGSSASASPGASAGAACTGTSGHR